MLRFLAFSYLNTGRLYVSPILRSNPLSFAYPSSSGLRPLVDNALIRMLGDTAWNVRRSNLQAAWFPEGTVTSTSDVPEVDVPMLIAALVVIFTSVGIAVLQALYEMHRRHKLAAAAGSAEEGDVSSEPLSEMHQLDMAASAASGARHTARAAVELTQAAAALAADVERLQKALLHAADLPSSPVLNARSRLSRISTTFT